MSNRNFKYAVRIKHFRLSEPSTVTGSRDSWQVEEKINRQPWNLVTHVPYRDMALSSAARLLDVDGTMFTCDTSARDIGAPHEVSQ